VPRGARHGSGGGEAARTPDDPRLAELVGDLSIRDTQFRQWWAGTHVAAKRRGRRRYNHPVIGEITLEWDALTSDAEPDQHSSFTPPSPAPTLRRPSANSAAV
jgi:hypothetical protein